MLPLVFDDLLCHTETEGSVVLVISPLTIEACVARYGRHYRFLVLYTSRVNLFLTKRFDHTMVVFFSPLTALKNETK